MELKKLYAWLDTIAREFCSRERAGMYLEFKSFLPGLIQLLENYVTRKGK